MELVYPGKIKYVRHIVHNLKTGKYSLIYREWRRGWTKWKYIRELSFEEFIKYYCSSSSELFINIEEGKTLAVKRNSHKRKKYYEE